MVCDPAKRITAIIISASDGQSYCIKQTVILLKEVITVIIISASEWQSYPIKQPVKRSKEFLLLSVPEMDKATTSGGLWSCQKR